MPKKLSRRGGVAILGTAEATVRIYSVQRSNGDQQFSVAWHEAGKRKIKAFADKDAAYLFAQQTVVQLQNGAAIEGAATLRDVEVLKHCERITQLMDSNLMAAVEEWMAAKKLVPGVPLSEIARFYAQQKADVTREALISEVAEAFIESRIANGVSDSYVKSTRAYLKRFTAMQNMPIADITVQMVETFLRSQTTLAPVTRNNLRRTLVNVFGYAKKQGYLSPDRKTAPELADTFKVPDKPIEIYTPKEMRMILASTWKSIRPLVAIGAFSGIRSAEIQRLHWDDIKWDRRHIEIAGKKAKTAARRLVPLSDNLKAWLAPWRNASGPIITLSHVPERLCVLGRKSGIPGGWRKNALRHSYVSYRVALTGDVPRTALECGNSPEKIFRHYREVVTTEEAREWFSIMPES